MKKFVLILLFAFGYLNSHAQSYTLDPTFQPFFDISPGQGVSSGIVGDVYEDPHNGKLYIGSEFNQSFNNQWYNGYVSILRNGTHNTLFQAQALGRNGLKHFKRLNDTVLLLLQTNAVYLKVDTLGAVFNLNWATNVRLNFRCKSGYRPYFFPNGSALLINYTPGLNPNACDIITPTDTLPYQAVVRIDSLGNYDSTFKRKSVFKEPDAIIPYDNQRVFLTGIPRRFKTYDSVLVNGVARVYLDGTLDTTFSSPVLDTSVLLTANSPEITPIENSDKVFLHGLFFLKKTRKQHNLVRLNVDGSIDTTFNYNNGPTHSIHNYHEVRNIVPTDDGGYIISGTFDSLQGFYKNNLAKIDSNGFVEAQYFTTQGPDSSYQIGNGWAVVNIEKSAFGGYYVYGDFSTWDGQPSQPIVRINGLVTGVEELQQDPIKIKLYPNPTDDLVTIATNQTLDRIEVYDMQGKLVQRLAGSTTQFELPEQVGLYFIRVYLEDGNFESIKILKK